ncbi:Csu type fimbrial protein [Pseudomonas sp. LB3P38]|uniref:Csu type fimbrial protein n=1 Tax=Pseudomonas lyxosi TaxID=3398358 RepID=UPI0039F0C1D7
MHMLVSRIGFSVLVLALASNAQADTTTGQITSSMTLSNSCQINGAGGTSGMNFGALDFGSTGSLFTTANGQVLSGGGALSILCSSGTTPAVKVRAGAHDGGSDGGTRALMDVSGNNFVPYDLYTDSGHQDILAIDGVINLDPSDGSAQTVNIYGKAVGKAGLPAGIYSDTVAVELSF